MASPRTAFWAAPALLLPLFAIVLSGEDRAPSPIEQTIESLPVPVDSEAGTQALAPGATPLGDTRLPTGVTMPIYNNSAQALAARMLLTTPAVPHEVNRTQAQIKASEYEAVHPQQRMMDDLLVGQVNGLLTSPVAPDISAKIFEEYCHAKPGDPYYAVDIQNLPIDRDTLASLIQLAKMTTDRGFCPHLTNF